MPGKSFFPFFTVLLLGGVPHTRAAIGRLGDGRPADSSVLNAPKDIVAFVDVNVVPMDRERVLGHQTVVVRGEHIVALGPAAHVAIPRGANRIDGRDKYLVPGLGDMHAHILGTTLFNDTAGLAVGERTLLLYLANGVTVVRDLWASSHDRALRLRDRAASGELMSPRIYAAAGPADGAFAAGPAAADSFVAHAKRAGYDLIKVYGMDGPALDSLARVARRAGLPIAGHAPSWSAESLPSAAAGLQRAIDVGYVSIEHLTGFESYVRWDDSTASRRLPGVTGWWGYMADSARAGRLLVDTAAVRARAVALRDAGVWICPTLAMFEARVVGGDDWPEMHYLRDSVLLGYRQHRADYVGAPAQAAIEARRTIIRLLRESGTGLLLGTDSPVPFMLPGFGVHRELEALVRAGLTPYEALATGTRNVAMYFGALDSTGTVEVSKRADLVLLSGHPLDDIRNTTRIAGVMTGGRWYPKSVLDARVAALEKTFVTIGP